MSKPSNPQTIGEVEKLLERLHRANKPPHTIYGAAASTIEHQLSVIGELREALEAAQFDCRGKCPVCAGWGMSESGETPKVHNADCIVGKALSHPIIGDK